MTQIEKDTETKKLQTMAKDYQAEIGFLTLQKIMNTKRMAELSTLMAEGERQFQVLQQTKVDAPLPTPEIVPANA